MVYLLNDGLSGGNPNKRPLENGHYCSSLGNTRKFKPRKVSAVRDFPQGCGRDAQLNDAQPRQSVILAVSEQGEFQSSGVVESPRAVHSDGNMVVPHFDSVDMATKGNGGIEVVTQSCTERETKGFRMPANLKRQEVMDAPAGSGILVIEKADGTETSVEPEIQSAEVLGNPLGMQADKSLDGLIGKVVAVVMDGMDNQFEENVLDVKPLDIELPKDLDRECFVLSEKLNEKEPQVLVKELDNVDSFTQENLVPDEVATPSSKASLIDREVLLKDDVVPSPKDKFRRRRVSATRDFPLYCGRNGPPLAEEENLRFTAGDNSLTGIKKAREAVVAGGRETQANIKGGGKGRGGMVCLANRMSSAVRVKEYEESEISASKEIVIYEPVGAVKERPSYDVFTPEPLIVNSLMAAPHCPQKQGKVASSSDAVSTGGKSQKNILVAKKTTIKPDLIRRPSLKKDPVSVRKYAHVTSGLPAVKDEEDYEGHGRPSQDLTSCCTDIKFPLLPSCSNSSHGDDRRKVREMLHLFQTICQEISQGEKAKPKREAKRIDLEAVKIMKKEGIDVAGKKYLGAVPGVEVGDEFQYRVELAIVGVHRLYQGGIDYMKQKGMLVAISIVSSGAYADDKEDADSLIYCGQGGNIVGKDKEPEDQKLERGNLALRNSITTKNPVRVIHGFKETRSSDLADSKSKIVTTYVYDGLYTVVDYWQEEGTHGKQVFMFKLKKNPGQPELAWKEAKKSSKSKVTSSSS